MARDGKTHIFRGRTFTEAVAKAKNKLGKDISIVQRRNIKEKNLFSKLKLGGEALAVELEVEVTPPDEPKRPSPPNGAPVAPHPLLKTYAKALEGMEKHTPQAAQAMREAAAPLARIGEASSGIAGRLDDLQKALERSSRENADMRDELRLMLSLQARGGLPAVGPEFLEFHRLLVDADVDEDIAREVIEGVQRDNPGLAGRDAIREALRRGVARRIPAAGPVLLTEGGPTVVALVGPSGVGKSTSVVKLAIQYAVRGGKTAGVINEDLRRPGADAQINNLGKLFGIAVTTANEPGEIADVVKSMSNRDLILLDTGGRSPRDAGGIERLAGIVRAAGADEVHLLLSSVSSEKSMTETVARYRPVGFDRVMLTKLDECVSFGSVFNVACGLSEGFSYVTTGPDYAQPIEPADGLVLADLVLGLTEVEAGSSEGAADSA